MEGKNTIDVGYVAKLARLDISPEQTARLQSDLNHIVEYIEELAELDVSDVKPTAHAGELLNVCREDEAKLSSPELRQALLANAPALVSEDLVKVPQVVQTEGSN